MVILRKFAAQNGNVVPDGIRLRGGNPVEGSSEVVDKNKSNSDSLDPTSSEEGAVAVVIAQKGNAGQGATQERVEALVEISVWQVRLRRPAFSTLEPSAKGFTCNAGPTEPPAPQLLPVHVFCLVCTRPGLLRGVLWAGGILW